MGTGKRLHKVWWLSEKHGLVFLQRDWEKKDALPPLTLLPAQTPLEKLTASSPREFAHLAGYCKEGADILFIVHLKDHLNVPLEEEGCWVLGDFNDWNLSGNENKWRLSKERLNPAAGESLCLRVKLVDLIQKDPMQFKFFCGNGTWLEVKDSAPNRKMSAFGTFNHELRFDRTGSHAFEFYLPDEYLHVGNESIAWEENGESLDAIDLPPVKSFLSADTQLRLGGFIEGDRTCFRVFAPRAAAVSIRYSEDPEMKEVDELRLEKVDLFVWEIWVDENLSGTCYWILVDGENFDSSTYFAPDICILDPWARATVSPRGPAILLPDDRFPAARTPFQPPPFEDLVVLEGHVRDLVSHTPWDSSERKGTGFPELKAFILEDSSYLRTLGVNALELQPVHEFDAPDKEAYHWGYMPVNFFSPASQYGSDPATASQVEEFRELVEACHSKGISVILDVVYNHVGEPNNLLFLDKYYFFEEDGNFNLMNWSGCGNDLRTSAPIVRSLVVESLCHWVRTYDVDGFRFDLADLVGLETLREAETALRQIKPGIVLIAEPWSFRGTIRGELAETSYASWNDEFRNFLADYVHAEGNQDGILHFLKGSPGFGNHPWQSVNYTQSHDDYTWIDRITTHKGHNAFDATQADRRRTHLMLACLLVSPGIPMIAQGQDFLHSKHGVHNTYQRGDLNALDYRRLVYYSNTHRYARKWIQFRLSPEGKALRLGEFPVDSYFETFVVEAKSTVAVLYNAKGVGHSPRLIFAINPHFETVEINVNPLNEREFIQIADHERFTAEGLGSALIPFRNGKIQLPGLSLGLWKSY